MAKTAFLYTDDFLTYKLGKTHPLRQERLQMTYRLLSAYGLFTLETVDWSTPTAASRAELEEVHTPDFLNAVQRAGDPEANPVDPAYLKRYGLSAGDTPAFPGMYESAALYSGGSIGAAQLVLGGGYETAFNVAGGLHHAMPDRATGFCTFNDLAMAVRALQKGGCPKVAYIDIDAHHGDGVQVCFYDDPTVLTISLHETGKTLFPGTGFPGETGAGDAVGTSINLPFYPYTTDAVWHEGFDAVVPAALERFKPDALVLQLGADAHWEDPLAHLMLTSMGWMQAVEKLLALGAGKPIVVTGGGGYNIQTVPRLWTMVQAACAGVKLPDEVPPAYAAEYGITHLHDVAIPQIEASVVSETRKYMRDQVRLLESLLG